MSKPWYQSKTWWTNVGLFLAAALSLPELGGVVPSDAMRYVTLAAALINLYLRIVTHEPISLTVNGQNRSG